VIRHSRWIGLLAAAAAFAILPPDVSAQRHYAVPRPAVRPVHVSSHVYYPYYRPYYYRPYYYAPFYHGGFGGWYTGFGWYPYFGIGFGYGYPYPYYASYPYYPYAYPYGYYDYRGAARLQVQPRDAQVYVDGYFVGDVDNFDGWAQRLYVEPGPREVAIYRTGQKTYRQKVLFRPGATVNIQHVMQPLAPGESEEPPPAKTAAPPPARRDYQMPPQPREGAAPPRTAESAEYGAIAVRVQPFDAEVIVDGERWQSPEAGDLTLQLSEGPHRVEIRKSGYRAYSAEIAVKRGQTSSLNVSLSRQ